MGVEKMHSYLPSLAVAFLFLFNISESRSAPNPGFPARNDGSKESVRNAEVWNEVLPPGISSPEHGGADDSFENSKLDSNENDGRGLSRNRNDEEQISRQREQMNLANFANLLNYPEPDFGSSVGNGIGNEDRMRGHNELWEALDRKYLESAAGGGERNLHPFMFKPGGGHILVPKLRGVRDKMDSSSFPLLIKRSPDCLRKCIKQGLLHPAQCHSLC